MHYSLMSMLDVLRDPRWGRSEECYGEDPCLGSQLAKAAVTGCQEAGVPVVAKHFCAPGGDHRGRERQRRPHRRAGAAGDPPARHEGLLRGRG